jgi:DNA-binding NarL/FixJ family response regulator
MDKHGYHPASERHLLQHWMNLSHRDFAIRLDIRCKDLSDREKDICYLVALGLEFDHIAEVLDVQPRSVDRYISTICKKLEFEKGNKKLFAEFMAGWR